MMQKKKFTISQIKRVPFFISLFSLICLIYDLGFEDHPGKEEFLHFIYIATLISGSLSIVSRYFFKSSRPRLKILPLEILLFGFLIYQIFSQLRIDIFPTFSWLGQHLWLYLALVLLFIREFSALEIDIKRTVLNPAQLFILSFLAIIMAGTLLLLLPKATHAGISLIDALFTATSAVCVTGLIVVDTGSFFTPLGQTIIILLIQIGGIGIMTFASYFSFFFRGISSYENQLVISEMTNIERLGEVFSVLKKIILITFFIELVGSLLLFQSIDNHLIPALNDRIFFSIFHAVSGFCNAGFSTLENSFYEAAYRFNYSMHLVLSGLIIIGGLGFPIVLNLLRYLKVKTISLIFMLIKKRHQQKTPWLMNINTRIVLITSLVLTVAGAVLFFIFEYNNTLVEHRFYGKMVTAFFASVTTRTAGFNTVDTSMINIPTILIVIFLMWIGASPGSTGGGIKTSSLAIAVLNIISIAKGKTRLEVFNREVSVVSVYRAFTIMILSVFVISFSTFLIVLIEPGMGLLNIAFETFSAYSTVGLSRGITAELSTLSKVIVIATMFIGRISMLTLLIALFKRVSSESYRFPTENILIN